MNNTPYLSLKQLLSSLSVMAVMLLVSLVYPTQQIQAAEKQSQVIVNIPIDEAMDKKARWLVLGDRLSAAYGSERHQGWVALLQQQFEEVKVVNASISGETTSGGLQRLPELMQQYQPKLLVLELGANDALRGQDLNTTKANLQAMIELCLDADYPCQVILLGVRLPTNYGPAYDGFFQLIYQQLASQYQLLFDGFFIEPAATDPDLMQEDALHPNAPAQPIILERLIGLFEAFQNNTNPDVSGDKPE